MNSNTPRDFTVFDDMLEGVQVIDPTYKYLYVNQSVANHAQSEPDKLLGNQMWDVFPGIEQTEMFKILKECMESSKNNRMLNEFVFPDGSKRYFDLRFTKIEEGVMIMSLDTTEVMNLQVELQRLNNHLEEKVLERTEELNRALESEKQLSKLSKETIAFISHDFKSPLVAIQINVDVLEGYGFELEEKKKLELYDQIKLAVNSMFDTVNRYIESNRYSGELILTNNQEILITEFVHSIIDRMKFALKKNQQIVYNHSGKEDRVLMDPYILRSVITNLISNAVKYSRKDVVVNSCIEDQVLYITVKDKGIGIPDSEMNKLFTQYFRASNVKKIQGTGLGLNIVKNYIDMLQGKLEVSSELDEGSTFIVELPIKPELNKLI